jgi:hypothetical protein
VLSYSLHYTIKWWRRQSAIIKKKWNPIACTRMVADHNSVGLLWTSDRPVAETSTWEHTTLTRNRHPCPRWDSNPQDSKYNSGLCFTGLKMSVRHSEYQSRGPPVFHNFWYLTDYLAIRKIFANSNYLTSYSCAYRPHMNILRYCLFFDKRKAFIGQCIMCV